MRGSRRVSRLGLGLAAAIVALLLLYGTTSVGYAGGMPVPAGTRIELQPGGPGFHVEFWVVENNSRLVGGWGSDRGVMAFLSRHGEPPIVPPRGAWRFYCVARVDEPLASGHYILNMFAEQGGTTHIVVLDTITIEPPRAVDPSVIGFRGTACPDSQG